MASSFWQGGDSEERDGVGDVIGVTEEVVGFARDLALHPETWLDFPFPEEDNNFDGTFSICFTLYIVIRRSLSAL